MESSAINRPARPKLQLKPLAQSRGNVPPGSLVISDVFTSSESHGVEVAKAAWSIGFQGSVFYQQAQNEPTGELQAAYQALGSLAESELKPEESKQALETYALGPPLHMLTTGVDEVRRASLSGMKNSVLNLSSGTCKAQIAGDLYRIVSGAWKQPDEQSLNVVNNISRLFGLEKSRLLSETPEEANLERQKLQQSLIDSVDSAWRNEPRINEERGKFQKAVKELEANNNSVVIAAGNEGLIKPGFEFETGLAVTVPQDFEENVLECPDVTAVGATIILDGQEAPARYSSEWLGVDVYTSGDTQPGQEFDERQGLGHGSSLAAPRVGAVMARLHGENNELTSLQVENELRGLSIDESPILRSDIAQGYLSR